MADNAKLTETTKPQQEKQEQQEQQQQQQEQQEQQQQEQPQQGEKIRRCFRCNTPEYYLGQKWCIMGTYNTGSRKYDACLRCMFS